MDIRKKVLVVDDNPLTKETLTQQLYDGGYEVVSAEDGIEAWSKLQTSQRFSAVVLDWMMPKMSGIQLLQKMQKAEDLCRIPVIMLTNVDEKDNIIEAALTGAFDYLVKPAEKELLIKMLNKAILKCALH